jgi:hypothetical protein
MEQSLVNSILNHPPAEAWQIIISTLWNIFVDPIRKDLADAKTTERDRIVGEIDNLLAGAAWSLWQNVIDSPHKTSTQLREFWKEENGGKAILILDALSLREACWIVEEAGKRDFTIQMQKATLSEIPGDTTPFAKVLGYNQRSSLANNSGKSNLFPDTYTESVDIPFADCCSLIPPEPKVIFWHHWPDSTIHDFANDGNGGQKLAKSVADTLTGTEFWNFVERLATGRTLVITGDHGYAHAGLFRDLHNKAQAEYMKKLFKSGRSTVASIEEKHNWVPPLTYELNAHTLAMGRRKWKSPGGYPTLAHGGLSLLEVAVPFIKINKI